MSDGHGCEGGGADCGGLAYTVGGDSGSYTGTHVRTPVPDIKRPTINGAPVIEASHEYVVVSPGKPSGD
jgi:hypothetical protein